MVRVGNPVQVQPSRRRVSVRSFGGSVTPDDLANLGGWYDFADPASLFVDAGTTPVANDGDLIFQVNDKSGAGFHLTQATAGSRPAYKVNIRNGCSVSRYDGIADFLAGTFNSLAAVGAASVFFVAKATGSGAATQPLSLDSDKLLISQLDSEHWRAGGTGNVNYSIHRLAVPNTSWSVVSVTVDHALAAAEALIWVNGIPGDTRDNDGNNTNNFGTATLGIGATPGGSQFFPGDIGEAAIFARVVPVAEHNALGGSFAAKWGTSWANVV